MLAIKQNPMLAEAYSNLGNVYKERGQLQVGTSGWDVQLNKHYAVYTSWVSCLQSSVCYFVNTSKYILIHIFPLYFGIHIQ